MSTPESTPWPVLRVALSAELTEDQMGLLGQAAVDEGALGMQQGAGQLLVYLPRGHEVVRGRVEAALASEAEAQGVGKLELRLEELADAPWATAWKDDFKALPIGERMLIRPDWEVSLPIPAELQTREVIYIRPGGGFGTARHETTRLALELLEQWIRSGTRVLDFGAGSGILAIAAARLGAEQVVAIENDPQAIINARENIELNGLSARIALQEAAVPDNAAEPYNLIVCNMLPHEARPHWAVLAGLLAAQLPGGTLGAMAPAPNSHLIYSGLLTDQKGDIEAELAAHGLHARDWVAAGEWAAGVFGAGRA